MTGIVGKNSRKKAASEVQCILYDRRNIEAGQFFSMSDRAAYVRVESGAFVRIDKDKRSVKERKRARREGKIAAAPSSKPQS